MTVRLHTIIGDQNNGHSLFKGADHSKNIMECGNSPVPICRNSKHRSFILLFISKNKEAQLKLLLIVINFKYEFPRNLRIACPYDR